MGLDLVSFTVLCFWLAAVCLDFFPFLSMHWKTSSLPEIDLSTTQFVQHLNSTFLFCLRVLGRAEQHSVYMSPAVCT
jgi:hypothetical protein